MNNRLMFMVYDKNNDKSMFLIFDKDEISKSPILEELEVENYGENVV